MLFMLISQMTLFERYGSVTSLERQLIQVLLVVMWKKKRSGESNDVITEEVNDEVEPEVTEEVNDE